MSNSLPSIFFLIVLICAASSCSDLGKKKYTVYIERTSKDLMGNVEPKTDTVKIKAENDSLAYTQGVVQYVNREKVYAELHAKHHT